jgi:hypothetical protein
MSVKALPADEVVIMQVIDMLSVNQCHCQRCSSSLIEVGPAGATEAEDSPPAHEDLMISRMRLQISAMEASGDAVLSCLMGVVSSIMFVS